MKRKISKIIISFLLTLAMVVGLLPGMSLTAFAAEETLLTTLTFGGSSTYSETKSGVVSVTATNVTLYNDTYGWLFFDVGSLSVTAEEGYTINKCVFRQNNKQPITDTEAPFEIHFSDGCCTEDTNWDMDGVTSIEVYSYATPTHTHSFTYTASGATITATCEAGCPDGYDTNGIAVTLSAPNNLSYDGNAKEAVISGYPETAQEGLAPAPTGVTCYKSAGKDSTTPDGSALASAPSDCGNYVAQMTWGEKTVSVAFSIIPGTISASANDVTLAYDGTSHGISVNVTNPASGYTVKYGETSDGCTLDSSPAITNVKDSPKTVYYKVTAPNYNDITGFAKITINKADQTAPSAPTKESATGTSITLSEVEGCEYKMNEGNWQESPTFIGLEAGTSYTFCQRLKGDDNHNPSDSSSGADIRTLGAISAKVTFKVENGAWNDGTSADKTITLNGYEGDELKLSTDQIPAVGTKPADTYKAGSWDVTPDTSTAITSDTTFTYTYAKKETITHTVTFKVQKGSWDDGTTDDKTVTVSGYEDEVLKLAADQIPEVGKKPDENCKAGAWDIVPDTEKEITYDITCTYSYVDKDAVTATVTFKVVDGSWNDGTTLDKTVTFSGYEGDVFTLAADQIPEAGANPADTFKAGSWDKVPEADTEITGNVTYTYSYAKKDTISYKATFKVINGTWNDGTSEDVILTLSGYEGDTLKFTSDQIPAAGTKPSKNYKAGSWDASFSSENELTKDTTYTYTYKEKDKISQTVTFRVVNGAWDDGTTADKIVTLNGYEGDTLALKTSDIPSVGTKPAYSYKAGKWDIVPSSETEITEKVTYTYTYEKKEDGEEDNKITYSNTAGAGSVWTLGSTGTLTFTFSRNENDSETIKHFAGAKVDGKELGSNDYSFKPGSVVIDLKADYLNKLSAGKHTLTAMFDDGDDVTVEFTIKEKASEGEKKSDTTPDNKKADVTPGNKKTAKTDAPGTGDAVNVQLIFLVMVLSMCDIFALCNLRSKLDEKKRRR